MEPSKYNSENFPAQNLAEYALHVHALNRKWWFEEDGTPIAKTRHLPTRIMLMKSEIFEGFEGHRKNQNDDHLPHYPMLWVEMADLAIRVLDSLAGFSWAIKETQPDVGPFFQADCIESELLVLDDYVNLLGHIVIDPDESWLLEPGNLALCIIRNAKAIAESAGCMDFWQVVYEKLVYNTTRHDHSYAARAAEGGKKF